MAAGILIQLLVLFRKQWILTKRNIKLSLCSYFAPVVFVLFMVLIQFLGESEPEFNVTGNYDYPVAKCNTGSVRTADVPCTTVLYSWMPSQLPFLDPALFGPQPRFESTDPDAAIPSFALCRGDEDPEDDEDDDDCVPDVPYTDAMRADRRAVVRQVMRQFADANDLSEGEFVDSYDDEDELSDVQYVEDYQRLRQHVLDNPNRTQAVVVFLGSFEEYFTLLTIERFENLTSMVPPGAFNGTGGIPGVPPGVLNGTGGIPGISANQTMQLMQLQQPSLKDVPFEYALLTNSSLTRPFFNIKKEIDRAILSVELRAAEMNDDAEVDLAFKIGTYPPLLQFDAVASFGGNLFYIGIMFNFVLTIYAIVVERELRLRIALLMVGLSDAVYWFHRLLDALLTLTISTLLMTVAGYATGLRFFTDTTFGAVFLTFFMFGFAMIPIAFILAILISTGKAAFQAGMVIFVAGILVQSILASPFLLNLLHTPALFEGAEDLVLGLQFYPPFNFAKMMNDIVRASPQNPSDIDDTGMTWENATMPTQLFCDLDDDGDVPDTCIQYISLADSALFQFYLFLLYGFIAFLLYNCHKNERGRPFYFMFTPTYWRDLFGIAQPMGDITGDPVDPSSPEDVLLEARRAKNGRDIMPDEVDSRRNGNIDDDNDDPALAIRVVQLKKVFNQGSCGGAPFTAVKSLSLAVEEGQVFALLGHNGAGKSTSINIITGIAQSTEGDAFVYGISSNREPRKVQDMIGVCFQHDILWEQLTAAEHVSLFARLQGVPSKDIKQSVEHHLQEVGLYSVRDKQAGTFSGGMKRRLSVAIASVGDPKMIILDEPTTGLDPVSKHAVWDSIRKLKKGRVILLTTHSMEEADVLSDRIGIMAAGELKVIGTSLHLKNTYGAGYRINLACAEISQVPKLKKIAEKYLPGANLIAESTTRLVYELPNNHVKSLVKFSQFIESKKQTVMTEYEMSVSTLEEVFMRVSGHSQSND